MRSGLPADPASSKKGIIVAMKNRRFFLPLFDLVSALRGRFAFGDGTTYSRPGRSMSGCSGRLLIGLLVAGFALFQYYSSTSKEVNSFTGRTQHLALSPQEEIKLGLAS